MCKFLKIFVLCVPWFYYFMFVCIFCTSIPYCLLDCADLHFFLLVPIFFTCTDLHVGKYECFFFCAEENMNAGSATVRVQSRKQITGAKYVGPIKFSLCSLAVLVGSRWRTRGG